MSNEQGIYIYDDGWKTVSKEEKLQTVNKKQPDTEGNVQLSKSDIGLSNVDNAKQATKAEFDTHVKDTVKHITTQERTDWNAKETTTGSQAKATKALTDSKAYTDTKISEIPEVDTSHLETKTDAQAKLTEAKKYTDTKTTNMETTTGAQAKATKALTDSKSYTDTEIAKIPKGEELTIIEGVQTIGFNSSHELYPEGNSLIKITEKTSQAYENWSDGVASASGYAPKAATQSLLNIESIYTSKKTKGNEVIMSQRVIIGKSNPVALGGLNSSILIREYINNEWVSIPIKDDALGISRKISPFSNGWGVLTTSTGSNSTAWGANTEALGTNSTAFGQENKAEGDNSTAFGKKTMATGINSTTWGETTIALGDNSTAFGMTSRATGEGSTAWGIGSKAEKKSSTAWGNGTKVTGINSTAWGASTEVSGSDSTAWGIRTKATNISTTAWGSGTVASGRNSTAFGSQTTASGDDSVSWGTGTIANINSSTVFGTDNKNLVEGDVFTIGNGSFMGKSNGLTFKKTGDLHIAGEYNTTGADYAEMFEWEDKNLENIDRVALAVTWGEGELIKLANSGDEIIGIVSATAAVLGDNPEDWDKRFVTDQFGRKLMKEYTQINEEGEEETYEWFVENPEYDKDTPYISRSDRQEWDAIGLVGKLYWIDDGTLEVGDYATVGENGIATKGTKENGYRVMKRISKNVDGNSGVVKVFFK